MTTDKENKDKEKIWNDKEKGVEDEKIENTDEDNLEKKT